MPSVTRTVNEWIAIADELEGTGLSVTSLRDKIASTAQGSTEVGHLQLTLDLSENQFRLVFQIEDRKLYPGRYTSENHTLRAHDLKTWRILTSALPETLAAWDLRLRIDAECEMARRAGKQYLQIAVSPLEREFLDIAEGRADHPITHALVDQNARPRVAPIGPNQETRVRKLKAALEGSGWTIIEGLTPSQALDVTLSAERRAGYDRGYSDGQELILSNQTKDDKQDAKSDPEQLVVAKAVCDRWLEECRIEATAKAAEGCRERIDDTRENSYAEGHKEGYRAAKWAYERELTETSRQIKHILDLLAPVMKRMESGR